MRHQAWVSAAFALGLLACGAGRPTAATTPPPATEPEPPSIQALDFAPEDTFLLLQLDVARLRASPYSAYANEWTGIAAGATSEGVTNDAGLWGRTDRLFFVMGEPRPSGHPIMSAAEIAHTLEQRLRDADSAAPNTSGDEDASGAAPEAAAPDRVPVMILAEGQYRTADEESLMRPLAALRSWQAQTLPPGSPHVWRADDPFDGYGLGIEHQIIALGIHSDLDAVLAVASGRAPGTTLPAALRRAVDQIGLSPQALQLVAVGGPGLTNLLSHFLAPNVAEGISSVTLQIDAADGLNVSARFVADGTQNAGAVVAALDGVIEALSHQPALAMMGLMDVVTAMHTRVEDTEAVLELQLDDTQTRTLLDRVTAVMRLNARTPPTQDVEVQATTPPAIAP